MLLIGTNGKTNARDFDLGHSLFFYTWAYLWFEYG